MPLSSSNIVQTAKGSLAASQPTLGVATTAGNTVFVVVHSDVDLSIGIVGFDLDRSQPMDHSRLVVFRQADTAGAETTWTVVGSTDAAWVAYEVSGLYPAPDAYGFNYALLLTGGTLSTNAVGPSDADVFCLSAWAAEDPSGTTAPTWASYTNSYTESQEQAVVGASSNGLGLACAHKFPGSTADAGLVATLTVSGGHTAVAACILLVYRSTADPLVFATGFSPGTAVSASAGTTPYIPLVVGTPAVVADATASSGYAAEITASAATEGYGLNAAVRPAGTDVDVGHVRWKSPGSLPAGDVDLVVLDSLTGGIADNAVRFRASDSALVVGIAGGGGTPAVGPVVVPDTWYRLEWRLTFSAFTFEWRVDGTAQPTYTIVVGDGIANVYIGPAINAATATMRYTDWLDSATPADYPLGDCRVVPLTVDPAGTVAVNTAADFSTYTANGTINSTFDVTTARDNLDEIPFTIGASNDGIVQDAADTAGHVDVPLTSYTLAPGEVVMGARLVVLGWAVSATAATFGFRFYNGSVEEILVAGTVNPGFNNSTTAPGWFAKMVTLANINTQAKIDAATVRNGYSSDATPDIGFGAELVELVVRAAQPSPGKFKGVAGRRYVKPAVQNAANW
jgi:hypothetical protein